MVETLGRVVQRIIPVMSVYILLVQISITITTTICGHPFQSCPSPRRNVQSRVSELQLGFALSHIYFCPVIRCAVISSVNRPMDVTRTTHPGDELRKVFRQHAGELDGTTLLERLRALRGVRASRGRTVPRCCPRRATVAPWSTPRSSATRSRRARAQTRERRGNTSSRFGNVA